ncbi:PREDICTED: probable serpin E3, partial [Thamnophis sirtalis]|uniref:Probable serpin E3 n=1 Tax=Thamnophis sirtalis TaxID=35019 RepID=A0A6I9YCW3_9SAUR
KATLVAQSSAFMLPLSITSFLLLFCVLNIGSCESYNDLKKLETEFALTLYQKLAERNNRTNLVISPASISFSLGLLQFGAREKTFGQLEHALGYSFRGEFLVGSLDQISVVEIPYLEEKVSMFVVLPSNRRTSLARIETYLSAQTFSLWSSTLRRTAMDIFLPRFKIQNHLDLKRILPTLGITDMFEQTEANFKGISEKHLSLPRFELSVS